jgi:wyosine [tRNA(Phe)-imidazoG37] synthetase (radical SAM superfamily)
VVEELKNLPDVEIDYITFSGRGEPTLAANLGEVIKAVRELRQEPIAVLTNSSLIDREDVRDELSLADFVIAKLDAYSQDSLKEINIPAPGTEFDKILNGIKQFRQQFKGRFALQLMFTQQNKEKAIQLCNLIGSIGPDEIQINTPLRPSDIEPLSRQELFKIKDIISCQLKPLPGDGKINLVSVYDDKIRKKVNPISNRDTLMRREKSA